jgi:hypothetical protein
MSDPIAFLSAQNTDDMMHFDQDMKQEGREYF